MKTILTYGDVRLAVEQTHVHACWPVLAEDGRHVATHHKIHVTGRLDGPAPAGAEAVLAALGRPGLPLRLERGGRVVLDAPARDGATEPVAKLTARGAFELELTCLEPHPAPAPEAAA